jgi:3',5'-cyclic AMP phosphodiesterase CpdA
MRDSDFKALPYINVGKNPQLTTELEIAWQSYASLSGDSNKVWEVTYQGAKGKMTATPTRFAVPGSEGVYLGYRAQLTGLAPGKKFLYEVKKQGKLLFKAQGSLPALAPKSFKVVAMGDCGVGGDTQAKVMQLAAQQKPDFVVVPGDIVYNSGTAGEYDQKWWAYANGTKGAALMCQIPFLFVAGNHDFAGRDLTKNPDGLAYFYQFSQPLNGPELPPNSPFTPKAAGRALDQFLIASGDRYPRMASFSLETGGVHWTVLDSNPNVNWLDPGLRAWVENDLKTATNGMWKVVTFHHPPFHSSNAHGAEKQMRALHDLLVQNRVDLVLSGHVHNYQRSKPVMRTGKSLNKRSLAEDNWVLDEKFDGKNTTSTDGLVYIVTGGGGANLYEDTADESKTKPLPFTSVYSVAHGMSVLEFGDSVLKFKQIGADKKLIDSFTLEKKR